MCQVRIVFVFDYEFSSAALLHSALYIIKEKFVVARFDDKNIMEVIFFHVSYVWCIGT